MKSFLSLIIIFVGVSQAFAQDNDQLLLSRARAAYKAQNFSQAAALYEQIAKSSPRWALAREEKAWAYFRMKNYPQALSDVRSLTNNFLSIQIDLEPYLLQSLILLYSCDYKAVFSLMKDLKKNMSAYVVAMESLSSGKWNAIQQSALDELVSNRDTRGLNTAQMNQLPRRFYLDRATSAAIRGGDVAVLKSRLQRLAAAEDGKNEKMLQYMQLVEVEAVQRAFVPSQFNGMAKTSIKKDRDTMVFNNDQELWADEIDKTQVDLNLCASKTGRSL